MIRRLFAIFAAALAGLASGACCTSLPRIEPKRIVFPETRAEGDSITETRQVWRDEARARDVPVTIYAPPRTAARRPVVVFSHGIGEDRDAYAYLGRSLAQHGFLAVHVTHAGTDKAVLERGYLHLYRAVKQPENWVNRPRDVSFVLDRLASRDDADLDRVAAAGHSAGAFTAFALAGMRTTGGEDALRDPRVKVAVPISMPRLEGVVPPGGYDGIAIPVLNLTGTCDTSLIYRTFPRHRRIPFDQSRAPRQYLVTLERVNHDAFSAPRHVHHDAIAAVTIAFLRAWLTGDDTAREWFDEPGLGEVKGVRLSVERKAEGAR